MKAKPRKIEILIDGESPSDWFEALERKINDFKQDTDVQYDTRVQMIRCYGNSTGRVKQITIDSRGTEYKIKFDKPWSYEKDTYDGGWYTQDDCTAKRSSFRVLEAE